MLGAERFLREIRVTARLQHPNILPLFDSGAADAFLFYVMPFVEGETLRSRLDREKQFSFDETVAIVRSVASALDYAHAHGVIHRDIKPENILLEHGQAVLADFGIALAVANAGGERVTETGLSLGTPSYMSPEQASGDRELDARTDVYALGSVAYEMLAGDPPFSGKNVQAIIARILTEPPPSLQRARDTVPASIDAAIQKALAKVPADRFASAGAFAAALAAPSAAPVATPAVTPAVTPVMAPVVVSVAGARASRRLRAGAVIAVAVLSAVVAGAVLWPRFFGGSSIKIAVLPFENRGDSAQAYFADGMANEVRNKLTGIKGLEVIARSAMKEYRNTSKRPTEIGRELGVKYYLAGEVSFRTQGRDTLVEVSPELVNASNASIKWQGTRIGGVLADVFNLQTRIAGEVADSLGMALGADERVALDTKPTTNLQAYQAFLQGERAWDWPSNTGDAGVARKAMPYYLKAVEFDPGFSIAWARLAFVYTTLAYTGDSPQSDSAQRAAQRAIELKPNAADGHIAMAFYDRWVLHDHRKALDELRRIHDPSAANNEMLFRVRGPSEIQLGQLDVGIATLQHAQSLGPRSPFFTRPLAAWLTWVRRHSEAVAVADVALSLDSTSDQMYNSKILMRLSAGDTKGARGIFDVAQRKVGALKKGLVPNVPFSPIISLTWFLDDAEGEQWLAARQSSLALAAGMLPQDRLISIADFHRQHGDLVRARSYADSARQELELALKTSTDSAFVRGRLGLMLAFLPDRKREAIDQGERAAAMMPIAKDEFEGVLLQQLLVRIYMMTGEPTKALDTLEPLLKFHSGYLTPAWLRIDPTFAPLKGNPRFDRLAAGN